MKSRSFIALGILTPLLTAGIALAGARGGQMVSLYVDDDGLLAANGSLLATRQSVDSLAHIGCWVQVYADGHRVATCSARDASGATRSCMTEHPGMIKNALSLNSAGYVYFSLNADGSTCDRVIAVNASYNL
ncbi:MAG: hypothetical protein ACOY0T_20050 [Myxococcota bacterium]